MPIKCQERYWQELYDIKVHVNYLEIYLLNTEKIDKCINAFLAIASSSSIAGWAIWKEYQFIWASIIVLSQVMNAIKIYLPYSTRMKSLSKILKELEIISIDFEEKWFDISEGCYTAEEINKLQFELKKKKTSIMQKYLDHTILPDEKKYMQRAEDKTQAEINNYYNLKG